MPKVTVGHENGVPIELHYEDLGAGKPVVLIHGWPMSSRSWEPQMPALMGAGYRVIAYDRRGFGQSSQPWGGYDYDTLAADLYALMRHLDLRDVALVGFSMGGGEVARYVGRYGTERVSKTVLAAAVTPFLHRSEAHPEGALDDATIAGFEAGVTGDRLAFLQDFTKNYFSASGQSTVSEAQRQYACAIAAFASPRATLECMGAFALTDFRPDLAKFGVPTLVIHGTSDAIVPFEVSGKRAAKAIAGANLALVEGGPHGLNLSHSRQFNEALLSFLAG